MKLKSLFTPLLVGILALGIAGCSTSTTTQEIKIGATAGPHAQVAEAVAKEAQKQGIQLKVVEFPTISHQIKPWQTEISN